MSALNTKTFGVEMEFVIVGHSRASVGAAISAVNGVAAYDANYSHAVSASWKLVSDASVCALNSGEQAMEIVSPILSGEDGFNQVRKVCAVLQQLGAKVNKSCGLHVHVGARNMSAKALRRLAIVYAENEDVIDSLLPASRRANANIYCNTNKNVNLAALATAPDARGISMAVNGGSRYAKLNFTSFWRHGTVEFRHHSGTVDGVKVNAWVKACLRMVLTAEREQEELIMVPTQTAPQGNLRLRRIYDMVARAEGASREEIAQMLNRRTSPPVAKILTQAGIGFTVRRGRYYLAQQAVRIATVRPTLANWMARLDMPADEVSFWQARHALLANAAVNTMQGEMAA